MLNSARSFYAEFFPIFQIFLNTFACCLALLLIRVVYATQLHNNSKYLLYVWTIGYFTLFCANGALGVLNLISKVPVSIIDPPYRFYMVNASPGMMIFTIGHEIAIASERIYSSFCPEKYYYGSLRGRLMLFTAIIFTVSCIEMELINEGFLFLAGVILSIFDVTTLVINVAALRYCRARYEAIYGSATLNARYQVKEALDLAAAMQPAYIATFIAKNIVNFGSICTCITFDDEYNCVPVVLYLPWQYIEAFFCTGQSFSSLFLLCWLMFKHPRLRKNLLLFRGKVAPRSGSVVYIQSLGPRLSTRTESEFYFHMLAKAWA